MLDRRIAQIRGNYFRPNKRIIGIDITYDCNFHCPACCRSCSQAPAKEYMNVNQVEKFIQESIGMDKIWERIKIIGGEPTLHPDFLEILEVIKAYRQKHSPSTEVCICTARTLKEIRQTYWNKLNEIKIVSDPKTKEYVKNKFYAFNAAPVDLPRLRRLDTSNGCGAMLYCGIGLNRYGYYMCNNGAGIDRVFGFDIGRKSIPRLEDGLRDQMKKLCMYCGSFHYALSGIYFGISNNFEISKTWVEAYHNYRRLKPKLTLY